MKTVKTARLGLVALALAASFGASAATDVVQYSTGYFVDTDANKFNSPYYRGNGEDWGWTHGAILGPITSATLNISAYDVDAAGAPPSFPLGERDEIYANDSGTWTLLGTLAGSNNIWSYTTFALGSSFFDDINAGLQVKILIDLNQPTEGWFVTLAKSVVETEGSSLPPPIPGIPEPGTYAMLLAGLGLLGLAARRRKQKAA